MPREGVNPNRVPGMASVIVPCFNYGHFVAQTLDSVRQQSFAEWECLVVDDGSTDNTREVVNRYASSDARIKYLYQDNRGLSAARNRGIRESSGMYVQFLDADDLIEADKLKVHVQYLKDHPDMGIIYSPVRYFRSDRPAERRASMSTHDAPWMPEISGNGLDILPALLSNNIMAVNCALVHWSVIEEVGEFNTQLKSLEDWEYWIRCSIRGARFHFFDRQNTYALVRDHPNSMSKSRLEMLRNEESLFRTAVSDTDDPELRRLFASKQTEARKLMCRWRVENGMPVGGTLELTAVLLGERNYKSALKTVLCLLLLPLAGRQRFQTLLFDVSFARIIRDRFR